MIHGSSGAEWAGNAWIFTGDKRCMKDVLLLGQCSQDTHARFKRFKRKIQVSFPEGSRLWQILPRAGLSCEQVDAHTLKLTHYSLEMSPIELVWKLETDALCAQWIDCFRNSTVQSTHGSDHGQIELAPDHPKLDAALWKLSHPSYAQTASLQNSIWLKRPWSLFQWPQVGY